MPCALVCVCVLWRIFWSWRMWHLELISNRSLAVHMSSGPVNQAQLCGRLSRLLLIQVFPLFRFNSSRLYSLTCLSWLHAKKGVSIDSTTKYIYSIASVAALSLGFLAFLLPSLTACLKNNNNTFRESMESPVVRHLLEGPVCVGCVCVCVCRLKMNVWCLSKFLFCFLTLPGLGCKYLVQVWLYGMSTLMSDFHLFFLFNRVLPICVHR